MKKLFSFLVFACLFVPSSLMAQEILKSDPDMMGPMPRVFIGFSTGINAASGLFGIDFEPVLTENISVRLTGGVGGWGLKYGGSVNYFFDQVNSGSSISGGVSIAHGVDNISPELETVNFGEIEVPMNFNKVPTLNLLYNYNMTLGKKGKFVIGAGYALRLNSDPYEIRNSVTLTDTSERVMRLLTPGGLLLELRLAFGI